MLLSEMIRKKAVRREAVPAFSGHCDVLVAGLGTSEPPPPSPQPKPERASAPSKS